MDNNKKLNLILVLVILTAAVFGGWLLFSGKKSETAGNRFSLNRFVADASTLDSDRIYGSAPNTMATTSVSYFTDGATASNTLPFYIERADHVDVNVLFNASSTSAVLSVCDYYTNNLGSLGVLAADWFASVGQTTNTNTETTLSGPHCRQFTAPAAGVNRINFHLTPLAATHGKLEFGITGANGALWAEVVIKEPID